MPVTPMPPSLTMFISINWGHVFEIALGVFLGGGALVAVAAAAEWTSRLASRLARMF